MNAFRWLKEMVAAWQRGQARSGRPAIRFVRLEGLEDLEDRVVASVYTWDPANPAQNILANYLPNWLKDGVRQGTNGSLPGGTDQVLFDKNVTTAAITWNVSLSSNFVLQNGYTSTITITGGPTMGINSYLDKNIGADDFVLAFSGANGNVQFLGGNNYMGNLEWGAGGTISINGGGVYVGDGANLTQSTASAISINGGTLAIGPNQTSGTTTFELQGARTDITVNVNGLLDFDLPQNLNNTWLVDAPVAGPQINNYGTTYLIGTSNSGVNGRIGVPFENHGTLNVDTGGDWNFMGKDGTGNSLTMDSGEIFLMDQAYVSCVNSYTQTGGTLTIGDDLVETLVTVNTGTEDNFNGGKIVFNSTTGYGTLAVNNVIFNGVELDMRIDGGTNASDLIQCKSGDVCTINSNSVMNVTAVNGIQPNTWTLIKPNGSNKIAGDFAANNIHLPTGVSEKAGALPNSWQCTSN